MMSQNTYLAATRFGLGMGPKEVLLTDAAIMQFLWPQLLQPEATGTVFAGLASAQDNALRMLQARQSKDKAQEKALRQEFNQIFVTEMQARITHAINTATPFYERLVNFWSNHFAVSIQKGFLPGLAVAYEREAIRPHVTGRFKDMLLASARHPAMLAYLDNNQSIGADSMAGIRSGKGLNENLAREIMELHTLGVNAGYTQADVTNFAKVLTGWGIGGLQSANPGGFLFEPRRHEPGAQTVFGKTYPDSGEEQGISALKDFAAHPATAQHIAFKLARHFIADVPPESAVQKLAAAFLQSGGELKTVYRTLLELPEAWSLTTPKIKSDYDFIVSAARLCSGGISADTLWCLQSLRFLGGLPFNASSPAGLPDVARDIAGPEAILRRVEWAQGAGGKWGSNVAYDALANLAIGPIMSSTTKAALSQTRDGREGLALLLGAPEFQRR